MPLGLFEMQNKVTTGKELDKVNYQVYPVDRQEIQVLLENIGDSV